MDQVVDGFGPLGPALLRLPDQDVRAGIVTLHGAADGRARQPLFDHIARLLAPLGVAVLSYVRRPTRDGSDTPFQLQADDAIAAMNVLRTRLRRPVGVFGFSQGAWAASLAAADPATAFLIVLGCSGVSPAEQMRYYTDELLRRHGYSTRDRRQSADLRTAYEELLRHKDGRPALAEITARLQAASAEPWFQHAYLPTAPGPDDHWDDMDFDPTPGFDKINCPVLAVWGSDEECVPLEASRRAWQASRAPVTTAELPGCGHWPAVNSGAPGYEPGEDQLSEDFDAAIAHWLSVRLASADTMITP